MNKEERKAYEKHQYDESSDLKKEFMDYMKGRKDVQHYEYWLEDKIKELKEEITFARSFIRSENLTAKCAEFERVWRQKLKE